MEEELLCKAQSCIGTLCRRVKIFTFQSKAHIGLLRKEVKSVLKNCLGQTQNLVKIEVVIGCFVGNNKCFGVWPKHSYFNFFEGGLLCVEK
jgi:hypothetical protein